MNILIKTLATHIVIIHQYVYFSGMLQFLILLLSISPENAEEGLVNDDRKQ